MIASSILRVSTNTPVKGVTYTAFRATSELFGVSTNTPVKGVTRTGRTDDTGDNVSTNTPVKGVTPTPQASFQR